jgi:hypothetical protein
MTADITPLRWFSTEEIRKRVRCRRTKVIEAQNSGKLLFEQRGRVRYSPLWAIEKWEAELVERDAEPSMIRIQVELASLL